MKKIYVSLIIVLSFLIMNNTVNASGTHATEGQSNWNTLKAEYDKGLPKFTVGSSQTIVTLYGYSECNGTTCTVKYAGGGSSYEDILKKSVTCSTGDKHITIQEGSSGKRGTFDETKSGDNYTGGVYWAEDYSVMCVSTQTNDSVQIENPSSNGGVSNGGASNGGTSNGGTSNGTTGGYGSSSTVTNPEQGVTEYFVILGFVAIVSYLFMFLIKKYNLFKKI